MALLSVVALGAIGCTNNDQGSGSVSASGTDGAASSPGSQPSGSSTRSSQPTSVESIVIEGDLSEVDWEALVDKRVEIKGELVVVDTFELLRRGQMKLARQRLYVPTAIFDPNDKDASGTSTEGGNNVQPIRELQDDNDKGVVIVDDGLADQNLFPPLLVPELGKSIETIRVGSTVAGVSGRMVKAGRNLLLVVDGSLDLTLADRPERPEVGDADMTVASFNVLNYFTMIDDGSNNARGADSSAEFERQEAKLVSAISAMNADVIGLMELQNNLEAEQQLIDALNQDHGSEVYAGIGIPDDFLDSPGGGDSIRVGMIYRADRVKPMGDLAMIDDKVFGLARTPLVQAFEPTAGGKPVTVIVNHFKSKGGSSDAATDNKDRGDGQAAFNLARKQQAAAICDYLESLDSDSSRVLVIGDLNAYQEEDPIDMLRSRGLIDLHEKVGSSASSDPATHSFVYYGQSGSLDHAFATADLADDVTGVKVWHINSDEPRFVDYNTEYRPEELYKVNPYRSSDHDPVLIGIKCK
ncbi:MAG: ExeM/NucH family extracellular endonuclease [Planctomycetota bacterium]